MRSVPAPALVMVFVARTASSHFKLRSDALKARALEEAEADADAALPLLAPCGADGEASPFPSVGKTVVLIAMEAAATKATINAVLLLLLRCGLLLLLLRCGLLLLLLRCG